MSSNTKIYSTRQEVRSRLAELAIEPDILRDATMASEVGRSRASANHPPITGGFNGWADGVAALRDGLLPLGWTKSDSKGYATVVSPEGSHQLAVASGDAATGIEDEIPRTRSPKGPVTARAVEDNQQLSLLAELGYATIEASQASVGQNEAEPPVETWILLIGRDGNELRAELSRPGTMDEDDKVATWLERIILSSIDLDGPGIGSIPQAPESGPDFDVAVTRRTG